MPASFTQADRPIQVKTTLGKDVLLAVGFHGQEAISTLFHYSIEAKADKGKEVAFDKLLGQPITVQLELPGKKCRYFNGLCSRVSQGESDVTFNNYQLEIVPQFWMLTKKTQSRIFQQKTVPDILKIVLSGLDVAWELQGKYEPRDYCVQYRESDFNFASRTMEEEGIFYFFRHGDGSHKMVVSDNPQSHSTVPGQARIIYKDVQIGSARDVEDYIFDLAKSQEVTSGKVVLWDHCFELPHKHLEAEKEIQDSVSVGKVSHKLKVGENGKLEIYDWPGEYAQRFDGISPGGGERKSDLDKIYEDNKRTTNLRMQAEATTALAVTGASQCRQMSSGHKFTLATLSTDQMASPIKPDGDYVITHLSHTARIGANYQSGDDEEGFEYSNTFTVIPSGLPFRPPRTTPKPVVPGSQTAIVVGPPGEEIFTDKYGRVKVQFHWDREGKLDANSSCWIRVGQMSAGRGWGSVSIPRVGQEVIVDHLEGDPDQPIIVGMVFNPNQMPAYKLPDERTKTYFKSNTTPGGVGYNEFRFEDKSGEEQVYIHGMRNMDVRVRKDSMERVGESRHLRVGFQLPNDHKGDASGETKKGSQLEEVAVDQHLKVHRNQDQHVGGDVKLLIGGGDGEGNYDIHVKKKQKELIDDTYDLHVKKAMTETLDDVYDLHVKKAVKELFNDTYDLHVNKAVTEGFDATYDQTISGQRTETVKSGYDLHVTGDFKEKVDGSISVTIGQNYQEKTGMKHAVESGVEMHLKAGGKVVIEAPAICLKGAGGFIVIGPTGVIIQGTMVLINSGGAAVPGSGSSPTAPKDAKAPQDAVDAVDPKDANPTKPTDAVLHKTGSASNVAPY